MEENRQLKVFDPNSKEWDWPKCFDVSQLCYLLNPVRTSWNHWNVLLSSELRSFSRMLAKQLCEVSTGGSSPQARGDLFPHYNSGAKEPQNLPFHRVDDCSHCIDGDMLHNQELDPSLEPILAKNIIDNGGGTLSLKVCNCTSDWINTEIEMLCWFFLDLV